MRAQASVDAIRIEVERAKRAEILASQDTLHN